MKSVGIYYFLNVCYRVLNIKFKTILPASGIICDRASYTFVDCVRFVYVCMNVGMCVCVCIYMHTHTHTHIQHVAVFFCTVCQLFVICIRNKMTKQIVCIPHPILCVFLIQYCAYSSSSIVRVIKSRRLR